MSENSVDTQRPAACDAAEHASGAVWRFVSLLRERYAARRDGGSAVDERIAELTLADGALRDVTGGSDWSNRPSQIVVLGPTQSGKSTVVNLLLATPAAQVSPIAGFTVHPHGFVIGGDGADAPWTGGLFGGWTRCESDALSRDRLEQYALGPAPEGAMDLASERPCVLWDTPDFDSLLARNYARGVLETAALADVIVLVLSKEKYSDLSVWKMLGLIEPLGRSLVVCLNKLNEDGADEVAASLRERLVDLGGRYGDAPIVRLPYQPGIDQKRFASRPGEVGALRGHVRRLASECDRSRRAAGVQTLIRKHWDGWVAPIEAERAAVEAWGETVTKATDAALEAYRRDFLEHPKRFDTFRRAVVELLHLLELPGAAGVLSRVRFVLTWPARQLFAARESWTMRQRERAGRPHGLGSEETVLFDEIDALLTRLARDATRNSDPTGAGGAVWGALGKRMESEEAELRERMQAAARDHHSAFESHVHDAAHKLYETLKEKPAVLNTLRAARVTLDAAGIAIAVKTAGIGAADLIFAPAIFSVTSMLTEGALGSYMQTVAADLKKRQLAAVERDVIRGAWEPALRSLPERLDDAALFGVSGSQVDEARAALAAWEGGRDG